MPSATRGLGCMPDASSKHNFSSPGGWKIPSFLDLPRALNCEIRSLVGTFQEYTVVYPVRCGSWGCTRCAARMTTKWANRVAEANPERMVTFTKCGETREDIRQGLQHIIRDLRKEGYTFEYWGVVELHKSGKPHMHLVQRGRYIPKSVLHSVAYKNDWGHSDIRQITRGWSAARYCAKHLCHSHGRRWPGRLIRHSRRFFAQTQKELKEQNRDGYWKWRMEFGRADLLAESLGGELAEVSVGDMGQDWLMGEVRVGENVTRAHIRNERKGYIKNSASSQDDMLGKRLAAAAAAAAARRAEMEVVDEYIKNGALRIVEGKPKWV